jgi:hypothetical protein
VAWFLLIISSIELLAFSLENLQEMGVFGNLWETRDILNKAEEVNVKLDAREMSHIIEHIDSNSGITRDTIEAAIYKIKKPNHNKNNNLIYL